MSFYGGIILICLSREEWVYVRLSESQCLSVEIPPSVLNLTKE